MTRQVRIENDTFLTVCHIPRLQCSQATIEIPHPGVLEERERRVVSAGDAMRRARAVARATATRPKKLREIPRIKRGALKPPGGSVHLNAIHARGFVL